MKFGTLSRRKFLQRALILIPCAVLGEAIFIEPTWLMVRRLRIGKTPVEHRLVHFSDLHHKGNGGYLKSVVEKINSLAPDFVCFTGDLLEDAKFLPETLAILSGIKAPLYGVPGNRDYRSGMPFKPVMDCFAATGGAWLMDDSRELAGDQINLTGITCLQADETRLNLKPHAKNILLMHYPARVKMLGSLKFDLILAGHSHGGQVRLPLYGPLVLPPGVDEYDLGLFETGSGPIHVSAGVGYLQNFHFRLNCPPELTVIEL
jgi:predicted MPP superfamily phosphohydrolase